MKWIDGNFKKVSSFTWKDPKKTREYLDYLGNKLQVQDKEEWYRVSTKQVLPFLLQFLTTRWQNWEAEAVYSTLEGFIMRFALLIPKRNGTLLNSCYIQRKQAKGRWTPSIHLTTQDISPKWCKLNFLSQALWRNTCITVLQVLYLFSTLKFAGRRRIELDIWLPGLSLAFEYQGKANLCVLKNDQESTIITTSNYLPLPLLSSNTKIVTKRKSNCVKEKVSHS